MYTAQIKSVEKRKDQAIVQLVAVFTDKDTGDVVEKLLTMPYGFTLAELKEVLRTHVASLETTDAVITSVPLNTDIDLSRTKKEKENKQLEKLLREIDKTERMVKMGVVTEAEAQAELTTKRTEAKALKVSLDN